MAIKITARDKKIINMLCHALAVSDIWNKSIKPSLPEEVQKEYENPKKKTVVDYYFEAEPDVEKVWKTLQKEMPKVWKKIQEEFEKDQADNG